MVIYSNVTLQVKLAKQKITMLNPVTTSHTHTQKSALKLGNVLIGNAGTIISTFAKILPKLC